MTSVLRKKSILRHLSGWGSLVFFVSLLALLCGQSFAGTRSLKDPQYSFDTAKLTVAESPLKFMRSYVDYFYLLLMDNKNSFLAVHELQSVQGWCVGDAHPENFGALLLQDSSSIFTMNDLDDGGPCPVGFDFLRLLVSANLAVKDISIESFRAAYLKGLRGESLPVPDAVNELLKKSAKKGQKSSAKKIKDNKIVRDSEMFEVSEQEKQSIASAMTGLGHLLAPRAKLLDVVASRKVGGGSGGLLRYEVLIDKAGEKIHLELKEQVRPAIYPVLVGNMPDVLQRISKGVEYTQGSGASKFYLGLNVAGREMLMRPLFSGNTGLEIDEFSAETARQIVYFEAFTLGQIHARSLSDKLSWVQKNEGLPLNSLVNDVTLLTNHFVEKFKALKAK